MVKVVSEVCKHIGARLRKNRPAGAPRPFGDSNIQVNDGTRPFTATGAQRHELETLGEAPNSGDQSGLDATDDAAAAGGADQSGRSVSMAAPGQPQKSPQLLHQGLRDIRTRTWK